MNEKFIIFLPTDWNSSISIIISGLATFTVVVYGFYAKISRDVLGKMVLAVNIADLAFCLIMLSVHVYSGSTGFYCKAIQAMAHCSLLYSLFWGTFFGHAFYTLVKHQTTLVIEKSYRYYMAISSVCSIGLSMATFFTNYSEYDSHLDACVHLVQSGELDVTLILFSQVPITCVTVMGTYWYIRAAYLLNGDGGNLKVKNPLTLLVYPGIVIVCWLPVNLVSTLIGFGITPSRFVDLFTKNLYELQGFFDAVVYGITPLMRKCSQRERRAVEEAGYDQSLVVGGHNITPMLTDGDAEFTDEEPKAVSPSFE